MRPERLCGELTRLAAVGRHPGLGHRPRRYLDRDDDRPDLASARASSAAPARWVGVLPAAIGAKCAAPDRPVVCFTGDGGMWYHLTELDTAARYGINTVTVVNNNASLNQEQALNERIYGGVTPGSDRLWKLTDADFAAIAETMGCEGITVTQPDEMEKALDRALSANRPAVIDVKTDIAGIAPRAWD